MRDLIRPDASFTPRELFSRMQGAWFEPRLGYMWQDNNGVTPTVSAGQTTGLILSLDQQAQIGSQLATGTFTNSALYPYTTFTQNGAVGFTGTTAGSGGARAYIGDVYSCVNRFVEISGTISSSGVLGCGLSFSSVAAPNSGLANGASLSANGSFTVRMLVPASAYYVLFISTATGPSSITLSNFSIREIRGNHAVQATAANRPLLGRRYNLLTWSEDISNAAWGIDGTASKSDYRTLLTPAANDGIRQLVLTSAHNNAYTFSCVLSGSGTITVALRVSGGSSGWVQQNDVTLSATPTRFTASGIVTDASATGVIGYIRRLNNTTATSVTVTQCDLRLTADVGKDPAYQRITTATDYDYGQYPAAVHDTNDSLVVSLSNLGGGIFSASGSVYFATPQGMSALHSQSIGTTYTLPAPNSSIYGWCVFPARLAPPLEKRLELYMLRLAGLIEPDYLLDDNNQQLTDDSGELLLRA